MTNRFLSGLFGILALGFLSTAPARADDTADVAAPGLDLTTFVGVNMYRLNIQPVAGKSLDNKLQITCAYGCKPRAQLMESHVSGTILGAFPIKDGILTIWAVGDGTLIRVYHIGDSSVTKVLETQGQGQIPMATFASDGSPALIIQGKSYPQLLQDQKTGVIEPTHSVEGDLWVWDGKEYAIPKPAAAPKP